MGYVIGNLICDRVILEAPEDIPDFTSMKQWSFEGVCNNLKHWESRMDLNGRWESLCHYASDMFQKRLGETHPFVEGRDSGRNILVS